MPRGNEPQKPQTAKMFLPAQGKSPGPEKKDSITSGGHTYFSKSGNFYTHISASRQAGTWRVAFFPPYFSITSGTLYT